MNSSEGTSAIGRTISSMKKARSRYDDSIHWAQEANLLMLYALERIHRIKKAGIGGSWEMLMKEWNDVGLQMLAENPTLIAQLEALQPIVLPEKDLSVDGSGRRGNGGAAQADDAETVSYGLLFASVKALRDAFAPSATEKPGAFLKTIKPKAATGMQGMVYKLWYMRHNIPYEDLLPNLRAREAGADLLITDEVRWKMIVEACVEAGYLDASQGTQLIETKPSSSD